MHRCVHAYTCTYKHTNIHPSIHPSILTYWRMSIHAYTHPSTHPSIHKYMLAYIHACVTFTQAVDPESRLICTATLVDTVQSVTYLWFVGIHPVVFVVHEYRIISCSNNSLQLCTRQLESRHLIHFQWQPTLLMSLNF